MVRSVFFIFSFLSLLFFLSSGTPQSLSKKVRVQGVIDGDTIVLTDGRHLRYIGSDTPEIRRKVDNHWVYAPEPFGEEAKDYNSRLVKGKTVTLEFDREREDRFGRLLAYVFVGNLFVNAKLIEQGYAHLRIYPPNTRYADLFRRMEQKAIGAGVRIWHNKERG